MTLRPFGMTPAATADRTWRHAGSALTLCCALLVAAVPAGAATAERGVRAGAPRPAVPSSVSSAPSPTSTSASASASAMPPTSTPAADPAALPTATPAPVAPVSGLAPQGGGTMTEVVEFYAYDGVGSVRAVFDPSGAVVGQATYSPFGQEIAGTTGMNAERFTGQPRDQEAGLDAFGARSYQSRTGRFSTVDPLMGAEPGDPQSWNRYSYAANNPLMFVDPDGRLFWMAPTMMEAAFELAGALGGVNETITVKGRPGMASMSDGWSQPTLSLPRVRRTSRGGQKGGNQGSTTTTTTDPGDVEPLPPKKKEEIENAFDDLKKYQPSKKCEDNVLSKMPSGFSYEGLQAHWAKGASFYDGTRSSAPIAGTVYPARAAQVVAAQAGGSTVRDFFGSNPGVNAWTSMTSDATVVFFRPSAISGKNGGVNDRNRALLMHETLHSYNKGYYDSVLMTSMGAPPGVSSSWISSTIQSNCK